MVKIIFSGSKVHIQSDLPFLGELTNKNTFSSLWLVRLTYFDFQTRKQILLSILVCILSRSPHTKQLSWFPASTVWTMLPFLKLHIRRTPEGAFPLLGPKKCHIRSRQARLQRHKHTWLWGETPWKVFAFTCLLRFWAKATELWLKYTHLQCVIHTLQSPHQHMLYMYFFTTVGIGHLASGTNKNLRKLSIQTVLIWIQQQTVFTDDGFQRCCWVLVVISTLEIHLFLIKYHLSPLSAGFQTRP